jgi:hypothetical protein
MMDNGQQTTRMTTTTTTSQQSNRAWEREEDDGCVNVQWTTTEMMRMRGYNYVVDLHVLEELGGGNDHHEKITFLLNVHCCLLPSSPSTPS